MNSLTLQNGGRYDYLALEKKSVGFSSSDLQRRTTATSAVFFRPLHGSFMGKPCGKPSGLPGSFVAGLLTRMASPTRLAAGSELKTLQRRHVMSKSITSSVIPFSFDHLTVRAINRGGEVWFVAADVGSVLGLVNIRYNLQKLDDDEKGVSLTDTPSGQQEMSIINESGLYALILRSRKPEAKKFRKWVTSEVLPAIRKTGSYSLTINKVQQGEIAQLMADRFPNGKDRPYAWSRFNNHFRLASYKDLPASKFDEACVYIANMTPPALPKPDADINLLNLDTFKQVREIANQFQKTSGLPTFDIPDDVLAGIVAKQLWKTDFIFRIDFDGKVQIVPRQDPYTGLKNAIADPGNIGLKDSTIEEIGQACLTALAHRAKRRESLVLKLRGAK